MSDAVILDTGVLGYVVHPTPSPQNDACRAWLTKLLERGLPVYVPEIADYELRRELLRMKSNVAIRRLDDLKDAIDYAAITTAAMLQAAALWAEARTKGIVTAPPEAIDGDVILAAQTSLIVAQGHRAVVATTNVKHLSQFVDARLWNEIDPAALSSNP